MRCSYCFARDQLEADRGGSTPAFISGEAFEARLDFLDRSDIREIRLIGGEPTLHPEFPQIIERARLRGRHVVVFSHGLLSERATTCLEELAPDHCTIVVNANATRVPDGPTDEERAHRLRVLRRLGQRAIIGFTVDRVDLRLDSLLHLIAESRCRREIRLGLAHPSPSGLNSHLHPKQYPAVGAKVASFARVALAAGVKLRFDCGFVRCMFSEVDLQAVRAHEPDLPWRCNPILDVDLDGRALHCMPLSNAVVATEVDGRTASDLRAELATRAQPYRVAGVYRECSTCRFKSSQECTGGCLAVTMRRFRTAPLRLTVPLGVRPANGHPTARVPDPPYQVVLERCWR